MTEEKKTPRTRKSSTDVEGTTITIVFDPDGSAVPKVFDLSTLSPEIREQLALHGLKQKLTDSFAGVDLANIATAVEKVTSVWQNLVDGNWRAEREGGGSVRTGKLAEAIANLTKQPIEAIQAKLDGIKDTPDADEALKALRNDPAIKAEMARIRQEELAAAAKAAAKAAKAEGGAASVLDTFKAA